MASYWEAYTRARIARRALLRSAGVAAAAAGGIAIAGCGGGKSARGGGATPSAVTSSDGIDVLNQAGPPRAGGRLVTANSATFGTFDPHLGIQVASAYYPRVYNVLLNQSVTKPEFMYMDLARSIEIPDDSTYIFKIRPGVKVAPNDLGVPERDLDGEDVRATFERIRTDPTTMSYAFAHEYIDSIKVDGDTVTITTPGPYAWFLNRVGLFLNCIAPRELLAGDLSRLTSKAAGAGPYRLTSITEGEKATFARNPNYYRTDEANGGARLPYIDELEVKVIFERATQRTAYLSGQIHVYWPATGEEARTLPGSPVIARDPNFAYISMTMNPRQKPFDDPRARRAISRAIDRGEYVNVIYGGDAQEDGLVQWSLGSYALPREELRSIYQPFNLEEARALVGQVGGIRFKMMYPANTTIEEHGLHLPIFLGQMAAAGIEIEQDPQDFGKWVENYHNLNYESSLALNQIYETPELPLQFHTTNGPLGDNSYVRGLGDPEIDAAVKKANQAHDATARREAVHAAQKLIYARDPMYLPLVTPYQYMAYSARVKNIPSGIGTTSYLVNTLWLDT